MFFIQVDWRLHLYNGVVWQGQHWCWGGDNTRGLGLQHVGKPQPGRCTNALWSSFFLHVQTETIIMGIIVNDIKLTEQAFFHSRRGGIYIIVPATTGLVCLLFGIIFIGNQRFGWKQWYRRVWWSLNSYLFTSFFCLLARVDEVNQVMG